MLGKEKQPMRIMMEDERIFSMAGLFDTWIAPDGTKINSCTIITTEPNDLMRDIHNRMPVILEKADESIWLDKDRNIEDIKKLLRPFPADKMRAYPVSKVVGNVKNIGSECIDEMK